MPGEHTIQVTADTFQLDVLQQSMQVPVLLDFWASWCGPCRTLAPVLEKLADEYGGAFVLGKIDADAEQDLAAAFQVRGIPFVVLMDQGRPVDAFNGALPESEVRRFLQRNGIQPVVRQEDAAPEDPDAPAARLARAVAAARVGDVAAAESALDGFPVEDELAATADRVRDGLAWFGAELGAADSPAAAHLASAREQFLAGRAREALDSLLESVTLDRGFADGLARKAMLLVFAVLGEDHDVSDEYRRRLTTLLY
ncbi:MAG: tetratricopeptide repeat protein [Planctomycetota bacterium]